MIRVDDNMWNELYEHSCHYNLVSLEILEINVNPENDLDDKSQDRYIKQKYAKIFKINNCISLTWFE